MRALTPRTPLETVAADGRLNVLYKLGANGACDLERTDFEEQFTYAEDDAARVRLCRRWSRVYEPPRRKARPK